ncbi:hypothetical protein EMA8858_04139 [Emticicia aquatica]|uniref:KilA-N domain-containing protein n=1 Tax=Emticicia aquatica TaxID=1681835 RepID=A0ABN8F2C4_9BACT|nr:KilA-N domain-containing protein [Emticicia aquatica]CAH0998004.1 hypothetical protein EMA8858_04139 [Emticicia aquatica]
MSKNRIITVNNIEITVTSDKEEDYISLTDMVRDMEDSDQLIKKWLSTKNTIEYLGVWERLKNPDFNLAVFGQVKNEAGSNNFTMSVKKWIAQTNGISLKSRSGRYGSGTFAHKDVAMKFAAWISPEFELLVILEFQRLKEQEVNQLSGVWDLRRLISKVNYKIQTDAIKEKLIPIRNLPKDKEGIIYAEEAEILNFALFGMTSKEWKQKNPQLVLQNRNIRDYADTHQLIILANLESLNAEMLKRGVPPERRLGTLREVAVSQLKSLSGSKDIENILVESPNLKSLPNKDDKKLLD